MTMAGLFTCDRRVFDSPHATRGMLTGGRYLCHIDEHENIFKESILLDLRSHLCVGGGRGGGRGAGGDVCLSLLFSLLVCSSVSFFCMCFFFSQYVCLSFFLFPSLNPSLCFVSLCLFVCLSLSTYTSFLLSLYLYSAFYLSKLNEVISVSCGYPYFKSQGNSSPLLIISLKA